MTSSGLIIVLRQADDVYVVDHEGSIVGHIGDDSRADGVRAPVAMGIGSGDTLYVVDPAERNVQVYTVTEDGLKYVRSMPSNAGYFDVCVTGDRVYALAPGSPRLIHELERDGSVLRSFGELDPNGSETTAETRVDIPLMVRTDGWLSCSRAHDLVVFVGRMTGRVHAYSLDGDLRWRVDLTEFSAPRLREGRCCSFLPNRDSGSIEEVKAVVIDSDSGELLVSSYDGPMHQPGQHKVRLIRITDGKHVAAHTGPLVVLGLTTNGYYGLSFDEGLRVLQFTYRDGT